MHSVMLDLETFGTRPGSVIRAIGAVKFSGGQITDRFYQRIDAQSCVDAGLKMDVSTVQWWLAQTDAARLEMTLPGVPLSTALQCFTTWFGPDPEVDVWGNGATFDNILLTAAYEALNLPRPWHTFRDRCYRTVKNLFPQVKIERGAGTHHNALDDAAAQAAHLMAMLPTIYGA
jgi:hypothetical protein